MRGLAEKIWKVLAPSSAALRAASSSDFDREVWIPMRRTAIVAIMLWTVFVILMVLWLIGLVSHLIFGGFLHILLVVAIVIGLVQILSGKRAL